MKYLKDANELFVVALLILTSQISKVSMVSILNQSFANKRDLSFIFMERAQFSASDEE
jgi:hypothetical protein